MKRKLKFKGILLSIIAVIVIFMMVTAASGESKLPETVSIKIGSVMTLTGPAATWHNPMSMAEMVYIRDLNKRGGIKYIEPDGTKHRFVIDHKYEDCGYDPQRAVMAFGRLSEWGAHVVLANGSTVGGALIAPAMRKKVPVVSIWAVLPDPRYFVKNLDNMYFLPSYKQNVELTMSSFYIYKTQVWEKKNPGKPFKVGVIAFDNPPRRLYKEKYVKKLYAKAGIDLVGAEIVPLALTDTALQLNRLHRAGANTILIDHVASGAKVVLEDAKRLGIKDELSFISWFLNYKLLMQDPHLFDGIYNCWGVPMYYTADRTAKMERIGQVYLDADPEYWKDRLDIAINNQHYDDQIVMFLKKALEKYGYKGLTRERIREVMFSSHKMDDGIYPKFAMSPELPYTNPYSWLHRFDGEKGIYQPVGPPAASGPSPYTKKWNPFNDPKKVLTNYYDWP